MPPAEIDGWLSGVQRSLIHQRTDWHCALVLAGTPESGSVIALTLNAKEENEG